MSKLRVAALCAFLLPTLSAHADVIRFERLQSWPADIPSKPGHLALTAPVLKGVTGAVRDEFVFDHMRVPATATLSWPIADPSSLKVTVRAKWDAPREQPDGLAIRATGEQTVDI